MRIEYTPAWGDTLNQTILAMLNIFAEKPFIDSVTCIFKDYLEDLSKDLKLEITWINETDTQNEITFNI